MATFETGDDDTQNQDALNNANANSAQNSTVALNAGSGLAGSNSASTSQTAGSAGAGKPTSSGAWTNLNQYLDANSDQGANVANTLASGVAQSAQTAQNDLSQNVNSFQNQYSSIPTEDQAKTNIQNTLGNYAADTAGSDNVNQYQNYLNNNYQYNTYGTDANGNQTTTSSAPQTLENYTDQGGNNLWGKTTQDYNTAANNLSNTQTESGRDTLLNSQYGAKGNYTSGQQSLDQYILQGNQENQGILNNTYNQYQSGIVPTNQTLNGVTSSQSGDLNNALANSQAYNKNVLNNESAIQSYASTALQNAITQGTSTVNNQLSTGQSSRDSDYQSLATNLANNSLTDAQLASLGLTKGTVLYNTNLSNYLSAKGSDLNVNNTATADDYAAMAALQNLAAGQSYAGTANLGLSGTAPQAASSAYTFNSPEVQQILANAATNYNNNYNANGMTNPAGHSYSYSDLQNYAQTVANAQYGGDINALMGASVNPNSNAGTAQQYINQVNAWKNAQGLNNILN